LNLLIDAPVPIVANAAQRTNWLLSADGPRNIVDAVDYILSRVWADEDGRDELGVVMIQDEQIFAARQVQKSDARPGGYVAAGDHGGVLGTVGVPGPVRIYFRPETRHTWQSELRLDLLPETAAGTFRRDGAVASREVRIKDERGLLIAEAIPRVGIVKFGNFTQDASLPSADQHPDILARSEKHLRDSPLAGFVAEGLAPYGLSPRSPEKALEIAVFSGMPVVQVGRGNAGGAVPPSYSGTAITGSNLTATKARILLMACLLKFGSLPPARDPHDPSAAERKATAAAISRYQKIFDTH
jgi:L-asparaginase/Glu-tRNA(Gln) amidotransferase subunit D